MFLIPECDDITSVNFELGSHLQFASRQLQFDGCKILIAWHGSEGRSEMKVLERAK